MSISTMYTTDCKNDIPECNLFTSDNSKNKGKRLPQYKAVFTVCIGTLAAGGAIGWTGNISEDMKSLTYNGMEIDDDRLGWIGSLISLGMMASCIPIGKLCDIIGRKAIMLGVTIPFTIGWLLILYAKSLAMLYIGRFLTGMAAGAFVVAAPIYTTEIAQKEIRGALGNCLELFVTVGVLLAYITPMFMDMRMHTYTLAALPLLFAALFVFQPESPLFRIQQKRDADAATALMYLRGSRYDIESELNDYKKIDNKITIIESLKKRGTQKAVIASFGLMFFQAMTGINVLVAHTDTIFESTGTEVNRNTATILLGVVQTIGGVLSCQLADRVSRRVLLIYSNLVIALSLTVMGIFTTLSERSLVNESVISSMNYVPLISLSVYMTIYSFAMGPIPWVINAEIFPTEIKGSATGVATTLNSFISFITFKVFFDIKNNIGGDANYYLFAGSTFVAVIFIYFCLPETKGKTLEEIQAELNK